MIRGNIHIYVGNVSSLMAIQISELFQAKTLQNENCHSMGSMNT